MDGKAKLNYVNKLAQDNGAIRSYTHELKGGKAPSVEGVSTRVAKAFRCPCPDYKVSYQWLRVVHASAQRLVVAFKAPWLRLLVADMLRKTFPHIIPQAYQDWPTVYLSDANAHVGSVTLRYTPENLRCSPKIRVSKRNLLLQ